MDLMMVEIYHLVLGQWWLKKCGFFLQHSDRNSDYDTFSLGRSALGSDGDHPITCITPHYLGHGLLQLDLSLLELETKAIRRFAKVSIVSYSIAVRPF